MKLIPIQSVSDIITNSSSEVFITLNNEDNKKFLDSLGIHFVEFKSIDDVREYIERFGAWGFDEFLDWNPYANQDWFIEALEKFHSKDAIWEFFKPMYYDLVGKLYIYEDRDYLYSKIETNEQYKTFNQIRL